MTPPNIGILLTNIGTPNAPTKTAVRRYLKKFLSDRRVVELPKFLWWPILNGLILPFRPKRSATLYQKIWTEKGSPLLIYSQKIAKKLEARLQIPVRLGMHYSEPSIAEALTELQKMKVDKILILPLYPQYSGTTSGSTFDIVTTILKKWRALPEMSMINHYAHHSHYIDALKKSILETWQSQGKAQHLLFSFHGIPKRYVDAGDPYPLFCHQTVKAVANSLNLSDDEYSVSFQSRLGKAKWLTPYTDKVFTSLPKKGVKELQVICPGFATDCLETLEEINIRGREQFLEAGGKSFHYIPALNDHDNHIEMLAHVILPFIQR